MVSPGATARPATTKAFAAIREASRIASIVSGVWITGSPFLAALNTGPECLPEVGYTCISTRTDTTVVPAESCFLDTATNLWVQDDYPLAVVMHADMPMDRRVRAMIVETVESLRPISPATTPS